VPNYEFIVICIMVGVFLLTMIALATVVILLNNKHRKKLEEITLYNINVNSQIDKSIPELLDIIISECFKDYRIKHLEPMEEGYIKEDREIEIRNDVVKIVSARISSASLDKISLFYNIENIAEVLADKIYIQVMDYVVEHNSKFMADEEAN